MPPVILIHGYLQNSLSWQFQLEDPDLGEAFRLIAIDLRGHGQSGKPDDPDAYLDSRRWADDIAAVLKQLSLPHAVLAGWSYGGYVIADYLRHYGTDRLAGVAMVASTLYLGGEPAARMSYPEGAAVFQGLVSGDMAKNVPALAGFAKALTAAPVSDHLLYEFMGYGAAVPLPARLHMLRRVANNREVAAATHLPVWIPHGDADAIIRLIAAQEMAETFPQARLSVYEGIGHTPFVEAPERFNRELFAFTLSAFDNALTG
jgi:pimeloyl-ACP methyl ester carboxylesterase